MPSAAAIASTAPSLKSASSRKPSSSVSSSTPFTTYPIGSSPPVISGQWSVVSRKSEVGSNQTSILEPCPLNLAPHCSRLAALIDLCGTSIPQPSIRPLPSPLCCSATDSSSSTSC